MQESRKNAYCKRPKSNGFPSMTPCSLIGGSLDDPHNPNTRLSNDLRGAYPLIKRLIGGSVDEPLEIKNEPRMKHGLNTDNTCGVGRRQIRDIFDCFARVAFLVHFRRFRKSLFFTNLTLGHPRSCARFSSRSMRIGRRRLGNGLLYVPIEL